MINLVRKNILKLKPYVVAPLKKGDIILNANENPYSLTEFNRYPELDKLLKIVSNLYKVKEDNILVSNGSDGAIDILIKTFCEPKKDNIIVLKPCFSMYKNYADIQDVKTIEVPLKKENKYQLNVEEIKKKVNKNTKIIFISNPSAPLGHAFRTSDLNELAKLNVILVIDEAYIEFSKENSFVEKINRYKNIVVLRTLSKAYGMAGLRIGFAISNKENINYLRAVSSPYPISSASIKICLNILNKKLNINILIKERERVSKELKKFKFLKVFDSCTNFLFIETKYMKDIQKIMEKHKIKLRYFPFGIRLSIGTKEENDKVLACFKQMKV